MANFHLPVVSGADPEIISKGGGGGRVKMKGVQPKMFNTKNLQRDLGTSLQSQLKKGGGGFRPPAPLRQPLS